MITPAQADELIAQHVTCLPIESLPLVQCAGAVLRENIYGERDQPPFDRVAMDGIAFDSAGLRPSRRFHIQAMQAAGDPPLTLAAPLSAPSGPVAQCIEIMTGAMLPVGCDTVVPVEQIELRDGFAVVRDDAKPNAPARIDAAHKERICAISAALARST